MGEVVGLRLSALLTQVGVDQSLQDVLKGFIKECSGIALQLRGSLVTSCGTSNSFGDVQLSVDLLAEQRLHRFAQNNAHVRAVSSEETTVLEQLNECGKFILCWDPLDGSSIVDANWSVGTILGVWQIGENSVKWTGSNTLEGVTGRQQVASLVVVYGPRCTCALSVGGQTFDLLLSDTAEAVCTGLFSINPTGAKIFAPANLRAAKDLPAYKRLVDYWMDKRYTLRYTGGLVPDVYQIFIKKAGVFANPASALAPAKLRLVYEVAPIAYLVENAQGKTSNGKISCLDIPITGLDHRTPFCCGSTEEVERFNTEMNAP